MSFDIAVNGPFEFTARYIAGGPAKFAVLDIRAEGGKVTLMCVTRGDCDALIKAALQAKDMLPPAHPCGDIAEHTQRPCELAPGHDGWHRAGRIVWPRAGEDTPAKPLATTCPICGTCLEPSGRCAVCTAQPIGEYPVSHLACGCQVQDVTPIGPGTPMVCERHGGTHVIPAETAPCPPGTCITCGATVSSAGVVTPAATA